MTKFGIVVYLLSFRPNDKTDENIATTTTTAAPISYGKGLLVVKFRRIKVRIVVA